MGRKSKRQKSLMAIIVITENSKQVIKLDKNERIKNLSDLSRLPKLKKKKYNRKIKNISQAVKKDTNVNDVLNMPFKDMDALFNDKSFLDDFTMIDKNLEDFDFGIENIKIF